MKPSSICASGCVRVLIRLYDVAIVVPLLVERLAKGARRSGRNCAPGCRSRAHARIGECHGQTTLPRFSARAGARRMRRCAQPPAGRVHAGRYLRTYAQEAARRSLIINYLLGTLQPGDSLAVAARAEPAASARRTSSPRRPSNARPSQANAQKRAFHAQDRLRVPQRDRQPLYRHQRAA